MEAVAGIVPRVELVVKETLDVHWSVESIENDGAVAEGKNLVVKMLCHSPRENYFLDVTSLAHEVVDGILVRDVDNVLLNDGTRVKVSSDVMARGANEFHSAIVRLMVRFGTDKGGKRGVVNVDDLVRVVVDEVFGEHLHVARQDDDIDVEGVEQFDFERFEHGLVVLAQREEFERDVVALRNVLQVGVVGDDDGDFDVPLARGVAREDVIETVLHLADKDSHARFLVFEMEEELHFEALRNERVEIFFDFFSRNLKVIKRPFHSHEEKSVFLVNPLVKVEDVSFVGVDEVSHGGEYALSVGAVYEQDGCVGVFCHNENVVAAGCEGM